VEGDAAVLAPAEQRESALMSPDVVGVLLQFEVVGTVVELVAVAVVDILAGLQRATQDDLHDQAGEAETAAAELDADVTLAIEIAAKWRAATAVRRSRGRTRS
jgi:hypothetical protein